MSQTVALEGLFGDAGSDGGSPVRYYDAPEGPTSQLNLRIEPSLRGGLEALARFWRAIARAQGRPVEAVEAITVSHVAKRLLTVGLDGAFAEGLSDAGLEALPQTDAEWRRLEQSLERLAAATDKRSK